MGTLLEGQPMGKAGHGGKRSGAGRPKGGRDDVAIKVERPIASMLKAIAIQQGVPVASIASDMLRGQVGKAYAQMLKKLEPEQ